MDYIFQRQVFQVFETRFNEMSLVCIPEICFSELRLKPHSIRTESLENNALDRLFWSERIKTKTLLSFVKPLWYD